MSERTMTGEVHPLEMYEKRAIGQLAKSLGDKELERLLAEVRTQSGVSRVRSPEDLLAFAEALMRHGGVAEIVGRSLKVHAHLKGARTGEHAAR